MRICIYGTGAVGGYFGGRLAEHGEEVVFVARGRTLEALRSDGLRVQSPLGDIALPSVLAVDDPAAIGTVDLVLVAVKAWQVPEVALALRSLVGPESRVVPLENGVEAADQLAAVVGRRAVLDGLCRILAHVEQPGRVVHAGSEPYIALGRRGERPDAEVEAIAATLRKPGITVETPEDVLAAVWKKFVFIAAVGSLGAAVRQPIGLLREAPETRRLLGTLMREVVAVGRGHGASLADGLEEGIFAFIDGLPYDSTASMQRDLMAGRPSELEAQTGAVVRLGEAAGVPTPVHAVLYDLLAPLERLARASGSTASPSGSVGDSHRLSSGLRPTEREGPVRSTRSNEA
jgi:2-dehydropantoate 2-reductase